MKRNFLATFEEPNSHKDVLTPYQLKLVFQNQNQVRSKETLKKVHDENLRVLKQDFPETSEEEMKRLLEDNDEDLKITSEMLRKLSQQQNASSNSLVRQIRKLKISSGPGAASDKSDDNQEKSTIEMEDSLASPKDYDEEAKRFAECTFENLKMMNEAGAKEFLKQAFLNFQNEVLHKRDNQVKQKNDNKENNYFACNYESPPNSKLKQIEEKGYLVRSCSKLKKMANNNESKCKEQEKIIEKLLQENQRLESQNRSLEQKLQESLAYPAKSLRYISSEILENETENCMI